jgi:hypothetical protein
MDNENHPLSIGAFKAFVTQYQVTQDGNSKYQKKSLSWSIKTFVAVSIYTAITAGLFCLGYCTLTEEKENTYYSQRASITLNDISLVPVQLSNVLIGYIVIPKWQNVGNTSANNMTFLVNFQFSRDDLPNGFTSINQRTKDEGPISIAPKETLSTGGIRDDSRIPMYYPQSCVNDMIIDKFRFSYIWGWAKYRDIFRPNKERVTRFCRRLYGLYTSRGDIVFNQYLCDEGNCQDDACDQYNYMRPPRVPAGETCSPIAIPIGAQTQTPAAIPPLAPFNWPPTSVPSK